MASAQTGQSVQYKTYLIALSATFLLGALPFVVFYWFLVAAGEHYKVDRVVAHQSKHGGLYGTAIHNSERSYKLAILEKTTPRIAVIGSSRVLQFRGEFFDSSFANLGRMLLSAQTARRTFSEVMKTGHPDILIVGVDYWWFSGGYTAPDRGSRDNGGWMEPASSVTVFRWLRDGKLKADRMVEVLMTRQRNIGVLAVLNQDGYDPYGARIRTSLATGKASSADARFGLSISAMETGRGNFPHGETFDETAWIEFVDALREIARRNTEIIVFLPPIAPTILQMMKRDTNFVYVNTLRDRVRSLPWPAFDFTNPVAVGATDCEFYDSVHAGVGVYARTVREMAKSHRRLAALLDAKAMERIVETSRGRASSPLLDGVAQEADFLGLGCSKEK